MASIAKGIVEIGKVIVKNAGKVSKGAGQETKNVGEVARKAGPSGKPALHFIDKSSKKGACRNSEAYSCYIHAIGRIQTLRRSLYCRFGLYKNRCWRN